MGRLHLRPAGRALAISYSTLAEKELGLKTYTLDETLIAAAESYVQIGLLPDLGN